MLITTTSALPANFEIKSIFSLVLVTQSIEVSNKGLIRNLIEKKRNGYDEAIALLIKQAPAEANAIISVQVSTAIQNFSNGVFLSLTLVGTPVYMEEQS